MLGVILLRRHPGSRPRRLSGIHNQENHPYRSIRVYGSRLSLRSAGMTTSPALRRKAERLLEARRIARPDLRIEHALYRLAVEGRDHLLGGETAHVLARLARDTRRVRRDAHVVELQERMFERRRLLFPHVESRTGDFLRAQRVLQRIFVMDAAARRR